MTPMTIFLYVMIFVISLLLIGLILIQPSKSGGMGAAFGGVGESAFGGKAGSHLTKTTVIMTAIFFVIALMLAVFFGRGWAGEDKAGFRDSLKDAPAAVETKAAPAEAADKAPAKAPAAVETKAPAKAPAKK